MTRFAVLTLALLTLSACVGSRPASDLYVLRTEGLDLSCAGPLVVDRPAARAEYNSKRIAVMRTANQLTYYTGASWASPFPEQLRGFLNDAFTQPAEKSGRHVKLTIQAAEVVNPDAPVVHLKLTGVIANGGRTTRIAIDERVPAAENHMPQIVDAFNEAAANAAHKIAHKVNARCSR